MMMIGTLNSEDPEQQKLFAKLTKPPVLLFGVSSETATPEKHSPRLKYEQEEKSMEPLSHDC